MFEPFSLMVICLTFLLAGTVKGVVGLGLPTVSLSVFAIFFDLSTAMALLIAPSLITNIWQALIGGHFRSLLARLWPFLTVAALTVWVGGKGLKHLDLALLTGLLGASLIIYAVISLGGWRLKLGATQERWAGPLFGAVNGVLTGLTGSFVVPGVMYLQSLGLSRDRLVQAMGLLFTVSTMALAVALGTNDLLPSQLALLSAGAVLPALLGMGVGQALRKSLSEVQFRRALLIALLVLGVYILSQAAL